MTSGDVPGPPGFVSRFTAAERSTILCGAREACATATELRESLAEVRREAAALRSECVQLRDRARSLRGRPRY